MWTMLLPYLTDSPLAYPFYILVLAGGIVAVGWFALGLIPKDATALRPYRYMRVALISLVLLLMGVMLIAVVILSLAFVTTAFGSPLAPPVPESFEERPAQRHYQTRHSHHRHAEHDDGDDEYRIDFQVEAHIRHQRGNEHKRREDVKTFSTRSKSSNQRLSSSAAGVRAGAVSGIGGRLHAFAGEGGGVMHFGGSHNRAILPRAG